MSISNQQRAWVSPVIYAGGFAAFMPLATEVEVSADGVNSGLWTALCYSSPLAAVPYQGQIICMPTVVDPQVCCGTRGSCDLLF